MKSLSLPIAALFIITSLLSCKKTDQGMVGDYKGVVSIQGKWSVKSDSVTSGVGPVVTPKTYVGKTGDYFYFDTNNKLYTKEGTVLDTFSYTILTDSTLNITTSVAPGNVTPFSGGIKATSATSVVVTWTPGMANYGSFYSRVVSLKK